MSKSLIDIAFEIVSKEDEEIPFSEIWDKVCKVANLTEEEKRSKIAGFYTTLSLDARFANLGENKWGIRDRYVFDKTHHDLGDVYNDANNTEGEDIEDIDEENDYNAVFEEPKPVDETEGFGVENEEEAATEDKENNTDETADN